MVLEKTLESPLDCKEIQPVHPKENQSWRFIARTDVEVAAPIPWPLMRRADSLEKTLMLGKIDGQRRRGKQTSLPYHLLQTLVWGMGHPAKSLAGWGVLLPWLPQSLVISRPRKFCLLILLVTQQAAQKSPAVIVVYFKVQFFQAFLHVFWSSGVRTDTFRNVISSW